jgi:hypothetical protein
MGCFMFRDLCIQPHSRRPDPGLSADPDAEHSSPDGQEAQPPQAPDGRVDADPSSERPQPAEAGGIST